MCLHVNHAQPRDGVVVLLPFAPFDGRFVPQIHIRLLLVLFHPKQRAHEAAHEQPEDVHRYLEQQIVFQPECSVFLMTY